MELPPGTSLLAQSFTPAFSVGVAVEPAGLNKNGLLVSADFNRLTAENAMKLARIHPTEDNYQFAAADEIADFARSHDMRMTGHALVWYREMPAWLTKSGDPGTELPQRGKQSSNFQTRWSNSKRNATNSSFELFVKNAEHITSVTFCGVTDDQSWLNQFPAAGRQNYPLLFDAQTQPKAAYFSVLAAAPSE